MAARVNLKLIVILVLVVGFLGAAGGAAWLYKKKTNVSGLVKEAEAYVAAGDFRKAASTYRRALGRDEANLEFLALAQENSLKVLPETGDEAREWYMAYLALLKHGAQYHPTNPEMQRALVEELHSATLRSSGAFLAELTDACEAMWDRLPVGSTDRAYAKYYRGSVRTYPALYDRIPPDEIAEGVKDLEEFLEEVPDSDEGHGALIRAKLTELRRAALSGQRIRVEELQAELEPLIESARTRVKDGPATLIALLHYAAFEREHGIDLDEAQALADGNRLDELVDAKDDPWLVGETVNALELNRMVEGMPNSGAIIDRYLEKHPDAHDVRVLRASLAYFTRDMDRVNAETRIILDADTIPVSFLSQLQEELKRRAAGLRVSAAVQSWSAAVQNRSATSPEDQEAHVAAIEEAVTDLEQYVTDLENDPMYIKAIGQVAFAKADYRKAASKFDQLLREGTALDFETMVFAAMSMEQVGELGAAVRRLEEALMEQQGNTQVMLHLASLKVRMAKSAEAKELVEGALALEPGNETAQRMLDEIKRIGSGDDELRKSVEAAQLSYRSGDNEAARSTLLALLENSPNNLGVIGALVRVEMAAGNLEAAEEYVTRGLEIQPGRRELLAFKSFLESPDPLVRIKTYVDELFEREDDRAVEMLVNLQQLVKRQTTMAERAESQDDPEAAQSARQLADRAALALPAYEAKAMELAPRHPRLIEYRFQAAATIEDEEAMTRVLADAAEVDADQARGAMFRGRWAAIQFRHAEAIAAFREAVERIPYSALAWRLLGASYQQSGDNPAALEAFARSYDNNPNDVGTVYAYSSLLMQTGNDQRALEIIRGARKLAPGNMDLRELWLGLEATVGDIAIAFNERRSVYKDDPTDADNSSRLALLLAMTEPDRNSILDKDGTPTYTVDRWNRLPEQGRNGRLEVIERERKSWDEEAHTIVDALADGEARTLQWYILKSDLYRERGAIDEGEEALRKYLEIKAETDAERLDGLLTLGLYQSRVGRWQAAEETFESGRPLQEDETRRVDRALAQLHFGRQRYEKAAGFYERALEVQDIDDLRHRLAECYVKLDQPEKAREQLALVKGSEGDITAKLLTAAVVISEAQELWAADDKDGALAKHAVYEDMIEDAMKIAPGDPLPHVLYASSQILKYKKLDEPTLLDDAIRSLARADEVKAGFPRTSLTRVSVLQLQGDKDGAVTELGQLLERYPDLDQVRQLMIRLLVERKSYAQGLEIALVAIEKNPTSSIWHEAAGDLLALQYREGKIALEATEPGSRAEKTAKRELAQLRAGVDKHHGTALEIAPTPTLVIKRLEIFMASDPQEVDEAIELAEKHADMLEDNARLSTVYARALALADRRPEAMKQMAQAYRRYREAIESGYPNNVIERWYADLYRIFGEDDPAQVDAFAMELTDRNLDPYELSVLAGIWRQRGPAGLSRSIELLTEAIEKSADVPEEFQVTLHKELGLSLLLADQLEPAADAYRKAVAIDDSDAESLNNLAYVLAESLDNPREALQYAEMAANLLPNDWSVLDTVGWIYFRLGETDKAEQWLRRSAEVAVRPENQIHLAHVFKKQGDLRKAQTYLERAAELKPNPKLLTEINRLADDIRRDQDAE